MILIDVVGIITLIALDLGFHHPRIENGIFAEALIDSGPAGITTEVNNGVIYPRTVTGTTLIGGDLSTCPGNLRIERGTDIDRLREECSTLYIGHAVVMVKTVDVRDADIFHRLLLDKTDPLLPLGNRRSTGSRSIEDGAHLPFGNDRIEHDLVDLPRPFRGPFIDIHGVAA